MPESDISKMKVSDLKRELKLRRLSVTGNKTELQERLQNALLDGDLSLEDVLSVLSDEEEKIVSTLVPDGKNLLSDEEEKIVLTDENELLKSPKSEMNEEILTDKPDDLAEPQREKVVFKRKRSSSPVSIEKTTATTGEKTDGSDVAENGTDSWGKEANILKLDEKSKQVIKIKSMLTWEERLQLRAKKFGLEEKKVKAGSPKVKFGLKDNKAGKPNVNSVSTGAGLKDVDPKQIETLKKRAERFGCELSAAITKTTADERVEKGKQRFGDLLSGSGKQDHRWARMAVQKRRDGDALRWQTSEIHPIDTKIY